MDEKMYAVKFWFGVCEWVLNVSRKCTILMWERERERKRETERERERERERKRERKKEIKRERERERFLTLSSTTISLFPVIIIKEKLIMSMQSYYISR